ncbi:MAG: iron hydrogenase small subunit [Anaerotardibacter sp.]
MSYTERLVGETRGVTRRQLFKGGIVAGISVLVAAALPSWAVASYNKAKEFILNRTDALYAIDEASPVRLSHQNVDVLNVYKEFLSPGDVLPSSTELSHRLCHTVYGNDIPAHIEELKAVSLEEAIHETNSFMQKGA